MSHAMPPPPRQRTLDERVDDLEERLDAESRERAADDERVFGDIGRVFAAQTKTNELLGSLDKRMSRVEVRLEAAIDKERAITDGKLSALSARHQELRRLFEDNRREMQRRLDELDKDVEASGQHGRATLDSVQRAATAMDHETKIALLRQEAANREALMAERLKAAEIEAAGAKAALAKANDRGWDWATWATRGAIGGAALAALGLIGWLAVHLVSTLSAPRPADRPAVTAPAP